MHDEAQVIGEGKLRNLDNQRQWGHLDFTISVIVGFSLLWGLAAAWEYCLRGGSAFDRNTAVTCGASVALCIILRPNHMKIFRGALGVIAGIAMEKYLFNPSETRALIIR